MRRNSRQNRIPRLRHHHIRPALVSDRVRVLRLPPPVRLEQGVESGVQRCARRAECSPQCGPSALSITTYSGREDHERDDEQWRAREEYTTSV